MSKTKKIINVRREDYSSVNDISNKLKISKLTARVLINRGIDTVEEAKHFLNPSLDHFHNPFLLKDMKKTVNRIVSAVENDENIWIYGDYDVDGVTSVSLFLNFLLKLGISANYYIPKRLKEGYGLNKKAIDYIYKEDGQLIVTVDCGISAIKEVDYCNSKGMDLIVTDHHQCGDKLPNAISVINPKREDCLYPFEKLCGAGVVFKIIQAISQELDIKLEYENILPLVAIGTVCDVVSLKGENRVIVKNGLDMIHKTSNYGIEALLKTTGLDNKRISSGHIGFVVGPRINAAGRMGLAKQAVQLLTSRNIDKATMLAKSLEDENKKRQEIENKILEEAEESIKSNIDFDKEKIIVLHSPKWHRGVIGIVSSRITEKYYRPSVLISTNEKEGVGSARSIPGFNLFKNLRKCENLFNNFGGHKQAAGLSIDNKNINSFKNNINEIANKILDDNDLVPEIKVDAIINSDNISIDIIKELNLLEPFGLGNSSPIFLCKDAIIKSKKRIGKTKNHLKLIVQLDDTEIDCIGFKLGYLYDSIYNNENIDIIIKLDINEFMGNTRIQFIIQDIVKQENYKELVTLNKNYYMSLKNILLKRYIEKHKLLKDCFFSINNNIDREEFILEKIYNDESTIVLVNNYENARSLLRNISISGRDLKKQTQIYYSSLKQCNIKCIKNFIIVNFNLSDFEVYSNYDNIILYDLCFIEDDFRFIVNYFKGNNFINLAKSQDAKLNLNILNKVIPTLDDLRLVYKTFMKNKRKILKINTNVYFKYLKETFGFDIKKVKFEIILIILSEAKLIKFKKDKKYLYIKLINYDSKINITKLPTYKYLNNIKNNFNYIQKHL